MKYWHAVIFSLMNGSIQHILTVMNTHELFLCVNAVMEYSAFITTLYIALSERLGRMTEQIQHSVYLGEKLRTWTTNS